MKEQDIRITKNNIVTIGHLLWEKNLASGLNGNISARIDENTIVMTAHGTCLGLLQENDILLMKLDGELIEEGSVSTEKLLHTEIYTNFPETTAVIHTHTTYTNAYFLENEMLDPRIFEAKVFLGQIKSISQTTPAVTDAKPVIQSLKNNNISVLRNHGVVAMGKELFDCFLLIQSLEEVVKTESISRLFKTQVDNKGVEKADMNNSQEKKYKLFSQEQINEIVKIVNQDEQMSELGEKTVMNMDLGIKLDETGQIYSFCFRKGRIEEVGNDENAEFLVSAPEKVWRSVFNREIDPFVATTQKKMNLRGDFAKISKWYAPCSRVFELWQRVPVE